MNTGQATQQLAGVPRKLTLKGVPVDPNLRILGVATLVNTFGNGASAEGFADSARRWAHQPVHRNPTHPDPGAQKTPAAHPEPATQQSRKPHDTWTKV